MSELKANKISPVELNSEVTLGDSGDTFTIPAGVTITNNGTQNGFGSTNASDLTSGTLPDARFPATLPAVSGANLTDIGGGGSWEYIATSTTGSERAFQNYFDWSNYSAYMFQINGIAMDNAGGGLGARFYDAGGSIRTSGYKWNYAVLNSTTSGWTNSNSNSDSFMKFTNYPSNGAPLHCNMIVWCRLTTAAFIQADSTWCHTHAGNYHGRSVSGGGGFGYIPTGIFIKQYAGVFQGGQIYTYRLKHS